MKLDLSKPLDVEKFRTRAKKLINGKAKIELTEYRRKRTLSQNALYWMWLTCIQNETGNDKDDLHQYFIDKYLDFTNEIEIEIFGEKVIKRPTTTALDTATFTAYLDKINIFASQDLGIYLPLPGMQGYNDFIFNYR